MKILAAAAAAYADLIFFFSLSLLSLVAAVDLIEFSDRGHALLDGTFDLLTILAASKVFQDIPLSAGGCFTFHCVCKINSSGH